MINFIGAYVVTICLFAIYKKRPSLAAGEARLSALPVWAHLLLLLYLAALALCIGARWFQEFLVITLPAACLQAVSFWIHEAGHVYFIWGGTFMHCLGGTLTEVLFPLASAIVCLMKELRKLGALSLYWLGTVCFDIAPYMADARARVLPLSTGDSAGHDWHNMLEMLGLLEWDTTFAGVVSALGWLITASAFGLYCFSLQSRPPANGGPQTKLPAR